jgi:hypothetical protein
MEEFLSEPVPQQEPKKKTKSKGFGTVEEPADMVVEEVPVVVEDKLEEVATPAHRTPLVRPMPVRKPVPRRGVRGASQTRP